MDSKRISRDIPLLELTMRRYEKPSALSDRELVRKLCLSLGLLQPGDSRDVMVDVLTVLLKAKAKKEKLVSDEIESRVIEERKKHKLPLVGVTASNIRRQLRRLREIFLAEKNLNTYRIYENASLAELLESKVEKYLLPSLLERVKEYCRKVDEKL